MFYGVDFIYNNQPSENYGLQILSFDDGGITEDMTGISYSIVEEKVRKNPIPYFFGTEATNKLQFTLTIGRQEPLDRYDIENVNRWLISKRYCFLKVIQPDLEDVNFNCIFTNPRRVQIGNLTYGFKYDVVCDAPFAWSDVVTNTYTISTGSLNVNYYCPSASSEYAYPNLSIVLGATTTNFTISNYSDGQREFTFSSISGGQTITVNNKLGIIESTGDATLQRFNKKWFRVLGGYNDLRMYGNGTVTISSRYPILI